MFTGIIEETGNVKGIKKGINSSTLSIEGNLIFSDIKIGDSIAVNGVCLTVKEFSEKNFVADVMHETLKRSTLGNLVAGNLINLERAMSANGRFGGHMVSGHIDGTGKIKRIREDGNAKLYTIEADKKIIGYIVEKGSIAIDGISLTVMSVSTMEFTVSVIPHTLKSTVLLNKKTGEEVNLENDIIGKYVEKILELKNEKKTETSITKDFLEKTGY